MVQTWLKKWIIKQHLGRKKCTYLTLYFSDNALPVYSSWCLQILGYPVYIFSTVRKATTHTLRMLHNFDRSLAETHIKLPLVVTFPIHAHCWWTASFRLLPLLWNTLAMSWPTSKNSLVIGKKKNWNGEYFPYNTSVLVDLNKIEHFLWLVLLLYVLIYFPKYLIATVHNFYCK